MECEKTLLHPCQKLIIMGDLNSDIAQASPQQTKLLFSFMNQFHLTELVQSPTLITVTTSSQLDLILTNVPTFFQNTVAIPCRVSDHHIILTLFVQEELVIHLAIKLLIYSKRYSKLDTCHCLINL